MSDDRLSGPGGAEGSSVTGLAHIAIALRDAEPVVRTLIDSLGATRGGEELLDGGALRVVFVHLGPVTVELLEPRSEDHTVAKFLEARGPGLHHVSFEVRDLPARLARAKAAHNPAALTELDFCLIDYFGCDLDAAEARQAHAAATAVQPVTAATAGAHSS